jgi:uncharacterized membrane protein
MARRKAGAGNGAARSCALCGSREGLVPAEVVRPSLADEIRRAHPDWNGEGFVCREDLNRFRRAYVQGLLERERGELGRIDREVVEALARHELLSADVDAEFTQELSLADRLSDRLASFGGSWTFILLFGGAMAGWIALNTALAAREQFDPYPFILLNLVLSTLAALQAPVIMMSQNRLEDRDRARSQHDYQVDLKAELEVRQLHEKLDHLLSSQWQQLLEVQEIQLELLSELSRR